MEKNAYFQIVHKPKRTMIKVIPSSEGGEMFSIDEVQQYLDAVNITSYDLKGLDYLILSRGNSPKNILFL